MPETPHTTRWGHWTYDATSATLNHDDGYKVTLDECATSAEALNQILEVHNAKWTTPEDVGYFVMGIRALLRPQKTLCSMGQDKRIDDVRAAIRENGYPAG